MAIKKGIHVEFPLSRDYKKGEKIKFWIRHQIVMEDATQVTMEYSDNDEESIKPETKETIKETRTGMPFNSDNYAGPRYIANIQPMPPTRQGMRSCIFEDTQHRQWKGNAEATITKYNRYKSNCLRNLEAPLTFAAWLKNKSRLNLRVLQINTNASVI